MAQDVISGDLLVGGNLSCKTLGVTSASINDAMVAVSASIAATKLKHRRSIQVELAEQATAVAAIQKLLAKITGTTATLVSVSAEVVVVATGADRTITVDLHKASAGGSFSTILSATIGFTNGSTLLTAVSGSFSSTALVAGDSLKATVAVAGAAGNQAKGLLLSLIYDEDAA